MMDRAKQIKSLLPYRRPFLFVDEITEVDDEHIVGSYKIKEDEYFLSGHFPDYPVVPGVIITEIMAQIGLVSLGIGLILKDDQKARIVPVFNHFHMEFEKAVKPGTVLRVESRKVYFRLGKLFCKVKCLNGSEIVARGEMAGMIVHKSEKLL